jgi:SAM-dependent methyltransferase
MDLVARTIARQSSRPRGVLGRLWGPLLDRTTRMANRHALEALALEGDLDVLEIGFDGGRLLAQILEATDGQVAGLELSDRMVERGKRRFRQEIESGRLRLERGHVAAIPFSDGSFDRVVTVHTIYFWPDTDAGLRQIFRKLLPGGMLVVGTATKEFLGQRRISQHGYRLFDDGELRELLERAGFVDVAVDRHDTAVISRGTRPGG